MEIVCSLASIRRLLVWCIVFLVLAGLCSEVADKVFDPRGVSELKHQFSLSHEQNVPTWFSTVLLFCCAIALSLIAMERRQAAAPYVAHWWILALTFVCISLDELAGIHENLSPMFDLEGLLFFGWVVPAGIFVALFGLSYLRFLAHLPLRMRNRMLLAGAIYVTGALLLELPLGWWKEKQGQENLVYAMIDLVEETLEMIGASLFLDTLLGYLAAPAGRFRISLREGAGTDEQSA